MKQITREKVKDVRVACPWLIKKFVTHTPNSTKAQELGTTPFDIKGVVELNSC